MKKTFAIILALSLLLALALPALADEYSPLTVSSSPNYLSCGGVFAFTDAKLTDDAIILKPGSTVTMDPMPTWYNFLQVPRVIIIGREVGQTEGTTGFDIEPGTCPVEDLFIAREFDFGTIGPYQMLFLTYGDGDDLVRLKLYIAGSESDPETGAAVPAVVRSPQNLMVNGAAKDVEKYNIDGSNYFKLRDIAYLLNGTGSQFSVGWDEATGTVSITTGEAYVPNGSEMIVGADKSATAVMSAQTIRINGAVRSDLSVYNLDGNNFFKLRDLGDALGFAVDYDAATNTAIVISK
jgi:hypothetical protein